MELSLDFPLFIVLLVAAFSFVDSSAGATWAAIDLRKRFELSDSVMNYSAETFCSSLREKKDLPIIRC